jgi:RND family efflux transporter MFP subunit
MLHKGKVWIAIIGIALLAAVGGYLLYSNGQAAAAQADAAGELQTAPVRTGSITVSATGAGAVIPAREVELAFTSAGVLKELLVGVGDPVQAGTVLARIDDTDARQALLAAQLQQAQAAMQTDASTTRTGTSFDDISIEQAQMALEQAQADLDDLLNFAPDPDEIALLEAQLASAEASYNAARGQEAASSTSIMIEQISVGQAERSLAEAQDAYNTAFDPGRDWELNDPRKADALEAERDRAEDALLKAQEALQVAQLNYNATVSGTNRSSSASAETNLLSAQQALEKAKSGPTEDEIAVARSAVREAELALKQAQLNQEANALDLQQAELNVQSAQAAVDGTTLTSPIDGVVTTINAGVGESVSGTVITVADLTQPLLEVYLDESDLNMVGLGYEVEVSFDALPDELFTGTVVQIDPELVDSNGVSAVRALVQLDPDSFAKPQTLPAGLNATVEVIGGRAENALLVPVEALREISDGQYAVFVMVDGVPELRLVEVGLMDYTYAEILSGLEQGNIVTTGVIETSTGGATDTTDESSGSTMPTDGNFMIPLEGVPPGGN